MLKGHFKLKRMCPQRSFEPPFNVLTLGTSYNIWKNFTKFCWQLYLEQSILDILHNLTEPVREEGAAWPHPFTGTRYFLTGTKYFWTETRYFSLLSCTAPAPAGDFAADRTETVLTTGSEAAHSEQRWALGHPPPVRSQDQCGLWIAGRREARGIEIIMQISQQVFGHWGKQISVGVFICEASLLVGVSYVRTYVRHVKF